MADLPENFTESQRDAYIKEQLGSLRPPPPPAAKTDDQPPAATNGQAMNGHAAERPEPSAVPEPPRPSAKADKASDEPPPAVDGPDWLDDETRSMAATLGISKAQLERFSSRESFDSVVDFLDQQALDAGRKQFAAQQAQQIPPVATQPVSQTPPAQQAPPPDAPTATPPQVPGMYQVKLDPEAFDKDVVAELNAMNAHYAPVLAEVQQMRQFVQQMQQRERDNAQRQVEQRFDSVVDSLGQEELFGETGKTTPEQMQNRRKLFDAHAAHLIGLKAIGRSGETNKAFVSRVMYSEFSDTLANQQRKQVAEKVKSQANRRLGTNSTASRDRAANPRETAHRELVALYNKMAAENG